MIDRLQGQAERIRVKCSVMTWFRDAGSACSAVASASRRCVKAPASTVADSPYHASVLST
jgi:hypothetical protein